MSTTLPALPPGEEWHNPENVPVEKLPPGCRFMLKSEIKSRDESPEIRMWITTNSIGMFYPGRYHGNRDDLTYAVPIATWPLPGQAAPESDTPIPAKLRHDIILQAIREIADEMERWPNDQDVVSHGIAAIQALTKFCDNTRS